MSDKFKVVEIFKSIEGEGIRAGFPCVFIRLYGCNCKCSYCDSQYACTEDNYSEMSLYDILYEVQNYNTSTVTITGGEPLIHSNVYELIAKLCQNDYQVNIETNGSIDLTTLDNYRTAHPSHKIIITMDWKSISSGMTEHMIKDNLKLLHGPDVLKFVVGSEVDLMQMKQIITGKTFNSINEPRCSIFVSPVFSKIEPRTIVEFLIKHNMNNVRLQLQLHKLIWSPDTRGV